ncbi:hypothetical protein [Nocardia sp. NPDC004260]
MNIEPAIPVIDKFGDLVLAVARELARRQHIDRDVLRGRRR